MIIGTTGPNTPATQATIELLSQQLNLMRINITQPIIAALAGMLELTEHEVQRQANPSRHYKRWGKNICQLEQSLCLLARTGNPQCFIDYAEQRIEQGLRGIKIQLFNGYLITGIGTELEAAWLRNIGGTLAHLHDFAAEHNPLSIPGELWIDVRAPEFTMADFIATLEIAATKPQEAA